MLNTEGKKKKKAGVGGGFTRLLELSKMPLEKSNLHAVCQVERKPKGRYASKYHCCIRYDCRRFDAFLFPAATAEDSRRRAVEG